MVSNIVVAGDVVVDWFFWTKSPDPENENINWKLFNRLCIRSELGGSLLVSKLLKKNMKKYIWNVNKVQTNLSEIQTNLNKTQQYFCNLQGSLKIIPEDLSIQAESLNATLEVLSETQEIPNITSEDPRWIEGVLNEIKNIQNSLIEIQKYLGGSLEIWNSASRNLGNLEMSIYKIISSLKPIEYNLSNIRKNPNTIAENVIMINKGLTETEKTMIEIQEVLAKNLEKLNNISIISQFCTGLDKNNPDEILHLNTKLDLYPVWGESNSKEKVYRVKEEFGATIPKTDTLIPLSIVNDTDELVDFIIIYDVGNEFRSYREKWPKALTKNYDKLENEKPVIIYNMYPPLFEGDLWEHTTKKMSEKLILVLNVEDLRSLGANISRSISWERTALDLVWEINKNPKLEPIRNLKNVIIRFKVEGAVYYTGAEGNSGSKLYFDPSKLEGGFWDYKKYGKMKGCSIVFISSLSSELINSKYINEINFDEALERSIKVGIFKSREFQKKGHGTEKDEGTFYAYFSDDSIQIINDADVIKSTLLPKFYDQGTEPDLMFWSILKDRTKNKTPKDLVSVAMEIVKFGWSAIEDFPAGRFGNLTTVDRAEIESFGSLKNIMLGYINSKMDTDSEKNLRPLSISVFGHPGSGKSFGITEVARSIDEKNIFPINFNVSQFRSIKDLINAFHRVRDISLRGKTPLAFFDEFDCTFEDRPLGWLRYFLAPMQDGEFMDCGTMHPIGKSIFVFAGGVYKSFQEFCENTSVVSDTQKSAPEKCPDFISRLRGNVNIIGPNRIYENSNEIDKRDDAYIIRRAVKLRSLIEKNARSILKEELDFKGKPRKTANIDPDLLKTLLIIPKYKHGVRSMEAIIDMSMLQGYSYWGKSNLPPKDQLELHVDGKQFFTILQEPKIYCDATLNYILNPNTQIICNYEKL